MLALGVQVAIAQQIAYIEMDKILEKMPAFEEAGKTIEAQANQWETELDNKYQSIESMYQEYVGSESMMPDDVKRQKQDAIFEAESKAKDFKEEIFGAEGALTKLQEETFGPLVDQVMASAEKVAIENGYSFVFNKSNAENWVYTNPEHDLTEKVISDIGL